MNGNPYDLLTLEQATIPSLATIGAGSRLEADQSGIPQYIATDTGGYMYMPSNYSPASGGQLGGGVSGGYPSAFGSVGGFNTPGATGYGSSAGSAGSGGSTPFSLHPSPTGGQGAFGMVPGQIGAPPSIWDETMSAVPGMAGLTGQSAGLIGSQMAGQISPGTTRAMTDSAASRGVSLGQPGGAQVNDILMTLTGQTSEQLQQQGQGNYLNFLGAVGGMQSNPNLLAEIASRNSTMAAAPDPTQAGNLMISLAQGRGSGIGYPRMPGMTSAPSNYYLYGGGTGFAPESPSGGSGYPSGQSGYGAPPPGYTQAEWNNLGLYGNTSSPSNPMFSDTTGTGYTEWYNPDGGTSTDYMGY